MRKDKDGTYQKMELKPDTHTLPPGSYKLAFQLKGQAVQPIEFESTQDSQLTVKLEWQKAQETKKRHLVVGSYFPGLGSLPSLCIFLALVALLFMVANRAKPKEEKPAPEAQTVQT